MSRSSSLSSPARRQLSALLVGGLLAFSGSAALLSPTSVLAATTIASGTLAQSYAPGTTSFVVDVTSPCIFSGSNPVSIGGFSPETLNPSNISALNAPLPGQQTLVTSPMANAHPAGAVVTQTVPDCAYPPLTITVACADNGTGVFYPQMTVTGGAATDLHIELGADAAFTLFSTPTIRSLNPTTFTDVAFFYGWPSGTIWVRWVGDHSITASASIPACAQPNTTTGSNVAVSAWPVNVTFATVGTAGTTSIFGYLTAPSLPSGYQIGTPPHYYYISTTATYSGTITVCISYAGITPAPTTLLHYENGAWTDITSSIDTVNQIICGTTTTLSPFALVTKTPLTSISWARTTSALGNILVGPFSFATKIQSRGKYITWKVDGGVALANRTIQVWVYKKYSANGKWIGPTMLTTRRANASGVAYLNIRTGGILWLSLRPVLPAAGATPASWGPTSIGRWR